MRCLSFFVSLIIVRKASPVVCNPVYSIRSMLNDKQMVRTHRHKWKKTTLRWFNLEIKIKKRKTSSSWARIDSVLDNCTSPLRKWHLVVNDAVHNRWQFGMLTVPQCEVNYKCMSSLPPSSHCLAFRLHMIASQCAICVWHFMFFVRCCRASQLQFSNTLIPFDSIYFVCFEHTLLLFCGVSYLLLFSRLLNTATSPPISICLLSSRCTGGTINIHICI